MNESNTITTDYFNYINKHSVALDNELVYLKSAPGIEQFLPYGQQLLLQETRENNRLLKKFLGEN